VLLAQLERLPEQNCRRTRNGTLLRAELANVTRLAFQPVPKQQNANSWYLLLGRIDARGTRHPARQRPSPGAPSVRPRPGAGQSHAAAFAPLLKRAPEQEQAVRHLIDQLHDPASPSYRHWLTPHQTASSSARLNRISTPS